MIYNNFLFKDKLPLMDKAMDTYALRQQTIAKNIANVNSPHYRPESVRFEEYFHNTAYNQPNMIKSDGHIRIGLHEDDDITANKANQSIPRPEVYFAGESHVNIDKEMSELAQNQIRFRFASRMTQRYFSGMMSAITGYKQ